MSPISPQELVDIRREAEEEGYRRAVRDKAWTDDQLRAETKQLRKIIWCLARQAHPEPLSIYDSTFVDANDHAQIVTTQDPRTRTTFISVLNCYCQSDCEGEPFCGCQCHDGLLSKWGDNR